MYFVWCCVDLQVYKMYNNKVAKKISALCQKNRYVYKHKSKT